MDIIRLADEAVSFAILAKGWISGDARSTKASIAVLIISNDVTIPIIAIQNNHSPLEILKVKPHTTTKIIANIIIIILCS